MPKKREAPKEKEKEVKEPPRKKGARGTAAAAAEAKKAKSPPPPPPPAKKGKRRGSTAVVKEPEEEPCTSGTQEEKKEEEDDKNCSNRLKKLYPHITCSLCKGYLIDATTVIECLHTFCKSCILTYFEEEDNCCPDCKQLIHQSHPSHYVAFDRTMQDMVYKLVPGLLLQERNRRLIYLKEQRKLRGEPDEDEEAERRKKIEEEKKGTNRCFEGKVEVSHHRKDEEHTMVELKSGSHDLPTLAQRYIKVSGMATVNTLKRYLANSIWQNVNRYSDLDIFCNNELMGRDFSMKFIHLTRCRSKPKDQPLLLVYKHRLIY